MNKYLIFGFILAILLIVVGVFASRLFINPGVKVNVSQPTETPRPTLSPTNAPFPTPSIPEGWESYRSQTIGLSLSYPAVMRLDENEDGSFRLLLLGPSQSLGTEVYDGIILNISSGTYPESSLKGYLDSLIEQKKNEPIDLEVGSLSEISLAGLTGYQFSETGLGTFINIYLPVSQGEFIHLSYLLEDPTGEGFQETLNKIFETVSLI